MYFQWVNMNLRVLGGGWESCEVDAAADLFKEK
jgi:hypothetical protein